MTNCPYCGMQNVDNAAFCAKCGRQMQMQQPMYQQQPMQQAPPQQYQQPMYQQGQPMQPMMQQPGKPAKKNMMLIIGAVVVAVIVVVAVLAILFLGKGPTTIVITDFDSTLSTSLLEYYVVFTVDLSNPAAAASTGTIHCKVTFSTGLGTQTLETTKSVTLAAGGTSTETINLATNAVNWGFMFSFGFTDECTIS